MPVFIVSSTYLLFFVLLLVCSCHQCVCACCSNTDPLPPASCVGGVFSELMGHLSSPGFPDASLRKLDCRYLISVEPGFTVTLNFTSTFHIESDEGEEGSSCLYHWLEVNGHAVLDGK